MEVDKLRHQLDKLSSEISECKLCDRQGLDVFHSRLMIRGYGTWGIVIGIEPGNTEIKRGEAFTGAGGKRLFKWLSDAGIGKTKAEIYQKIYFTSLLKCKTSDRAPMDACIRNCFPYLERQIGILKPQVAITLGAEPLQRLFGITVDLSGLIGEKYNERELTDTLFPIFPPNTTILPLPHPSPLSRWTNIPINKERLAKALCILREMKK